MAQTLSLEVVPYGESTLLGCRGVDDSPDEGGRLRARRLSGRGTETLGGGAVAARTLAVGAYTGCSTHVVVSLVRDPSGETSGGRGVGVAGNRLAGWLLPRVWPDLDQAWVRLGQDRRRLVLLPPLFLGFLV